LTGVRPGQLARAENQAYITLIVRRLIVVITSMMAACQSQAPEPLSECTCASCACKKGLSQEKLAEPADLHRNRKYVGGVERASATSRLPAAPTRWFRMLPLSANSGASTLFFSSPYRQTTGHSHFNSFNGCKCLVLFLAFKRFSETPIQTPQHQTSESVLF